MSESIQVWVRNEKGQVFGPLTPSSVELLIDQGVIGGKLQVSTDGEIYVFPGRLPGLRMVFPKETWGDVIAPADRLDALWSHIKLPPVSAAPATQATPQKPAGIPIAGPGTARTPVPLLRGSSPSGVRVATTPSAVSVDAGMPVSGNLASMSPLRLYVAAAIGEVTGLLTVNAGDREVLVHFKKGGPEFLDSTHPEDALAGFLVAQKLVTPQQIEAAQAKSAAFGGEVLASLFALGALNPNAVFEHLGQRAGRLLLKMLTTEQGNFTFQNKELAASRAMPLGNKWAVYLQTLRRVSGTDLRRRLSKALDLPVMKGTGRVPLAELKLTPQETRALNYFDGVRSLNQLIQDIPAETDTVLRTAWMLAPLEIVTFANVSLAPPKATSQFPSRPPMQPPAPAGGPPKLAPAAPPVVPQRPPPPVSKPAPAPVVTPAPSAAALDAETKQLEALFEQMRRQNFFEVLEVPHDADAAAVKLAYLKAARSHHPDTVAQGSTKALARVKADIFNLISEANRTLADPALRKHYAAELAAGGTGSKVDVETILRGEEVFQKGRILVQARRYPEALKMFEEAVGCNADEGEFYAWRGYTKFLVAADKQAALPEVMKDLHLCVKLNANVSATYYFLGFVAKSMGDEKAALAHFAKCVSLDPKHIDAQRELRPPKKAKE